MSGEADALVGVALRALEYVHEDTVVGLGTGRAATAFVRALGARVADGMKVRGVPTSDSTEALARELGIGLLTLEEAGRIDTTFDGADEVSPALDLIKGYGGALVREKIVAASSKRLIILVGDEKIVARVGGRGKLPVEVVPFGRTLCERELVALGCTPNLRVDGGKPYITDNHNFILDCVVEPIDDPVGLERRILAIPGVLGTGLFVGMADVVLVQEGDQVRAMERA
ncbi:MAG: ribose-5-phosphate isomerase RpiA [Candidatus Binatia bacterium]|nr:ribose-5-phosphate isomerase RpiA [Candidatus Binatia bacterium]